MPNVNGKKFAYTKAGKKKAEEYKKKQDKKKKTTKLTKKQKTLPKTLQAKIMKSKTKRG